MENNNIVSGNLLALFVLLVVGLLILEVPKQLLDLLIVANLVFAVTILLKALFSTSLASLRSFPSMLVLTSLYRLALTVGTTKLILLYGDQGVEVAGEVVRSFGQYASGEDPLVGAVLFIIVGLVNFLVIAKGSLRVAEVSARFNLDSLPGKQMAIDSDLRTGLISVEKASDQRKELSSESQFYGAIDGAMKWVQGDALTSLVVALACMFVGVGLGLYRSMSFEQALNSFGILTVGAGLVTILPSLLISVASGIIVSKVQSGQASIGEDLINNFFEDQKAPIIAMSGSGLFGLLALFGIINLPATPFILISSALALAIYFYRNPKQVNTNYKIFSNLKKTDVLSLPDLRNESVFRLEVGQELSTYLEAQGGLKNINLDLLKDFYKIQADDFFIKTGIKLPNLEICKARELSRAAFRILVRDNEIFRDSLNLSYLMLDCSRSTAANLGFEVLKIDSHPLKASQIVYIPKTQKGLEALKQLNINAHQPYQILVLSAISGILKVIEEVFGVDESKELVAKLKGSTNLVEEIFTNGKVSYPEYTELLRRLIREGVCIRDQKLILEAVVEFLALREQSEDRQDWLGEMHAYVRKNLSRVILGDCLSPGDKFRVFLLSQEVEEDFRSAVKFWDGVRNIPPLSPESEMILKESLTKVVSPMLERGALPVVVLCADDIRSAVQEFLLRNVGIGEIVKAVSFEEVSSRYSSEVIGLLGLAA